MLRSDIFKTIVGKLGSPTIDLFASRLNRQVSCYVYWRPDPEATHTDAFSVDWSKYFFYAFPPFSLVARCLQKVELYQTEGIMVVPNWPTQPWFSKLMQLLTANPLVTPMTRTTLQLPWELSKVHPQLYNNLTLLACQISGKPIKHKAYSAAATNIIVSSWRSSSGKSYQSYINRWKTYCGKRKIDFIRPSVGAALDFLVQLYENGASYSTLNTARYYCTFMLSSTNRQLRIWFPSCSKKIYEGCFSASASCTKVWQYLGCAGRVALSRAIDAINRARSP